MMSTVRWGMIGCGDVTERKSGPALQRAQGSTLLAVMRRNGDLARDYAARHGVPHWYNDASKLIGDPNVDIVYIATPPAFHKPYALACARAGKPAYVEKPMALNLGECQEMVDSFRQANLPLFVAYYRRALPRFLYAKQVIDSGQVGHVRFVQVLLCRPTSDSDRHQSSLPWRVIPEIAGGGHFVDLGCHTLDLLLWMLGPVRQVSGVATNQAGLYPAEDVVGASLLFDNGVVVSGLWCFCAYGRSDTVHIVGDQGSVTFSTFGDAPIRVSSAEGTTEESIENPEHIQQPLIQTIVDELRGNGRCPSTGESGLHTTSLIDQILEAWRTLRR